MRAMNFLMLLVFLMSSNYAAAAKNKVEGKWFVKPSALVCFTRQAYEDQVRKLNAGVEQMNKRCGVATLPIQVIVIDQNLFYASEVQTVDGEVRLFVGIEDLDLR